MKTRQDKYIIIRWFGGDAARQRAEEFARAYGYGVGDVKTIDQIERDLDTIVVNPKGFSHAVTEERMKGAPE